LLMLFDAIASSNWALTSQLLDSGLVTDVNAPLNDSNGYTALHWCAVQTPVPWPGVFLLLEHGCRVEQRDKDGTQPVFLVPNLPRIQQQLVNDAVDYLVRGGVDLPHHPTPSSTFHPASAAGGGGDRMRCDDGEEADRDDEADPVHAKSSGLTGGGGAGLLGAPGGGGAVNNIFRRLQQSAIINQAGHYLHQHYHPNLLLPGGVNKKSPDPNNISPASSGPTSTSIDYDSFEITSIKVTIQSNSNF
jgi:hypothetical protein